METVRTSSAGMAPRRCPGCRRAPPVPQVLRRSVPSARREAAAAPAACSGDARAAAAPCVRSDHRRDASSLLRRQPSSGPPQRAGLAAATAPQRWTRVLLPLCVVALQLGDAVAPALPPRRGSHDALVVDDAAPRPSRQLAEQYEREEWRGCARTPASEHPPPSLPLSPIARSVGWRALLAHRRDITFCCSPTQAETSRGRGAPVPVPRLPPHHDRPRPDRRRRVHIPLREALPLTGRARARGGSTREDAVASLFSPAILARLLLARPSAWLSACLRAQNVRFVIAAQYRPSTAAAAAAAAGGHHAARI